MATTTTSHHHNHHHHRLLQKPTDLEITIVSAKHLKNVNWRNGDLNPYAIFWVDPDRRLATKSDDSNSTKPVWNERFLLPLPSSNLLILTLQIFHSKPSDTPKPLVGTLRLPLADFPDPQNPTQTRAFDLRRPSGRLDGKIRLKIALRERALPDYQNTPSQQPPFYYTSPPPPSYGRLPSSAPISGPRYHKVSHSDPDPYSGYYQGGCYSQPRPAIDRQLSYASVGGGGGGGPSAPVDYGQYDQKARNGKMGAGSGLAGLAIDEGLRYEDGKKPDEYVYYRRVDY